MDNEIKNAKLIMDGENRSQLSSFNYPSKKNIVKEKSFAFALRIVKLNKYLNEEKREFVLSKQLLRSGTSVGAMVREAEQAESKADFIHKLAIALKEANECDYWIELLFQSDYLNKSEYESIRPEVVELCKLLTSIIKTSQGQSKMGSANE